MEMLMAKVHDVDENHKKSEKTLMALLKLLSFVMYDLFHM